MILLVSTRRDVICGLSIFWLIKFKRMLNNVLFFGGDVVKLTRPGPHVEKSISQRFPKIVGFSRVLRVPPTGKVDRVT